MEIICSLSQDYLLVYDGGIALALPIDSHKRIRQRLHRDDNLYKVVKRNIAVALLVVFFDLESQKVVRQVIKL